MLINPTNSTNIKWFTSLQAGSLQMAGNNRVAMLEVLDSCLITGYGLKTVSSIAILEGNKVVLDYGVGHNYLMSQVILIEGAEDALLNGEHKIIEMTNNTITLSIVGVLSTAGTITTKIAPLGWESIFGKVPANKRAYRSKNPNSSKRVLRLDMSVVSSSANAANYAKVDVFEDMTTIDEGVGSRTSVINTTDLLMWIQKSNTSLESNVDNTSTPWVIVGNDTHFYFLNTWVSAYYNNLPYRDCFGFGEADLVVGAAESGADNTFLIAALSKNKTNNNQPYYGGMSSATFSVNASHINSLAAFMSLSGGGFTRWPTSPFVGLSSAASGSISNASIPYPSAYGDDIYTYSLLILDSTKNIAGALPSILFIASGVPISKDCSVNDGVLLVGMQAVQGSSPSAAMIGFYVGG